MPNSIDQTEWGNNDNTNNGNIPVTGEKKPPVITPPTVDGEELPTVDITYTIVGDVQGVSFLIDANYPEIFSNSVQTFNYQSINNIKVSSSDISKHRITNVTIKSTMFDTDQVVVADPDTTLDVTIPILRAGAYEVIATVVPLITLNTMPTLTIDETTNIALSGWKQSIHDTTGVPIKVDLTNGVSAINVYAGSYKNKIITGGVSTIDIIVPSSIFDRIGMQLVELVPVGNNVVGNGVVVTVNVIDADIVNIPDIRNIKYPSLLHGADYKDTDVDFEISWDSVDADFVSLYVGEKLYSDKLLSSDTAELNAHTLLTFTSQPIINDEVDIELALVPHNIKGQTPITGRKEIFYVKFFRSEKTIPHNIAIDRIAEAFVAQFDMSVFANETSKYLTHLLHFGDGDNKVITTWVGDFVTPVNATSSSLVVKMYEPLPTNIRVNQQVWISKMQSNPILETVTLSGTTDTYCVPLRGPNFSLIADGGTGYMEFGTLLASGSVTSNDLLVKYGDTNSIDTTALNIDYVSGSSIVFDNFVHFGSAEERIKNFHYKIQLLESYQSKYEALTSGSAYGTGSLPWTGSIYVFNESTSYQTKIIELQRTFDGYENFLYSDVSSSLAWPKNPDNTIKLTTDGATVTWYDSLVLDSALYDKDNVNYLNNNIPVYLKEDDSNNDFIVFLDMIGQHFDLIWAYVGGLDKIKTLEHKQKNGVSDKLVYHLLESFGWAPKVAFNSNSLWEHAFGKLADGTQKYSTPLETARNEVWRRILNNLPYLLKSKGTARSMKALMACYGVPESLITIMEYGGPIDTAMSSSKFTFEDTTCAIHLASGSMVNVPWKVVASTMTYPNAIEFRIKPSTTNPCTILTGDSFTFKIVQTTGSMGKFELAFPGSVNVTSSTYPISTDNYSNVLINRYDAADPLSRFDVLVATSDGTRLIAQTDMTVEAGESYWDAGSTIHVGSDFVGELDEVRLWKTPLETSKFNNHALFPDAINGNSYTASTADLLLRLDFEYPKDRTSDTLIKNVAINQTYGATYVSASGFYSASTYPYQYVPYSRIVTAIVPSLGHTVANKIRFEDATLVGDLSYRTRATAKAYDRAPTDSNKLGIFMSPNKELNMDILKALGEFNIDNYIGNPADEYSSTYKELDSLRHYYFERTNRNINEYIQLIKSIDKSLFDTIIDLAPARAKISKGLLIEPHYLERSKIEWKRPTAVNLVHTASISIMNDTGIVAESDVLESVLNGFVDIGLTGTELEHEALVTVSDHVTTTGTELSHTGSVDIVPDTLTSAEYILNVAEITQDSFDTLTSEYEAISILTQVGMDPNSMAVIGYGLYANNGVGVVTETDINGNDTVSYDIVGNIIPNRRKIYLVTEQKSKKIPTQTQGYPATTNGHIRYEDIETVYTDKVITLLPFSGSSAPSVTATLIEVTPLNGYFPTHYKFTNNLGEGLQRSFFKGSLETISTTPDKLSPVETFTVNANIVKVVNSQRRSGDPVLEVV